VFRREGNEVGPHARSFYEAMGFSPLFESQALWGPENPALVLVRAIARASDR